MAQSVAKPVEHLELGEREDIELNSLGMWVYLASEIMFFGVLFTAYIVYRHAYPQVFAEASKFLDTRIGSINTLLLLSSSFTVALGVNATQRGERRLSLMLLAITVILGLGFLGLKFLEYSHEIENNLFPGGSFNYPGTNPDQAKLFFSLYFVMTGMHALHMVVGIAFVSTVGFLTWQQWITPQRYAPVELAALFWHFVDIVWIFIFPLLYLVA